MVTEVEWYQYVALFMTAGIFCGVVITILKNI